MKKKTMYTAVFIVSFLIIAFCVVAIFLSSGANKNFEITANGFSVSYYSQNVPFFASEKEIGKIEGESEDVINSVFGIYDDDEVNVRFEKEPIKVYYYTGSDIENKNELRLNRVTNTYTFCPMYDSEECRCIFVADYGIQKRIICFAFYNKDYAVNHKKDFAANPEKNRLKENEFDSSLISSRVSFDTFAVNYPIYSTNYTFSFTNHENSEIVTDGFIIEKLCNKKWCVVEKDMNSEVAKNMADALVLKDVTVRTGEKKIITLGSPLYKFFDSDKQPDLISGEYRIIIPYTVDGEKKYAVSFSMSVGLDSNVIVQ